MAIIGIVSVGITGRINSSCEIARRLQAAGHQIVMASTHRRPKAHMQAAGIPFYRLDSGATDELRAALASATNRMSRRQARIALARARAHAALRGHDIDGFIATHSPDLLLVESELHESIIYLTARGAPLALLEYHVSVHRRRGLPPLNSSLVPGVRATIVRAALAWRWTLLKRRVRQCIDRVALHGWDARSVWQRIARDSGVRLRDIATEDQWPMLLYPGLPCLHLCAPEFDLPGADDTRDFAGPVIQDVRPQAPDDMEAARCRAFLADRDTRRPLVASATGSILTLPANTRKMIDAGNGAGFDMIIAAGRQADPGTFVNLPRNVHVFRMIPQLEVLAAADLFVCHGGIASIHESILAGVPMLVCSAGHMDENGNAARVEYHGLGLRGDMRRESAAKLRHKIDRLLADDSAGAAVARLRQTMLRYRDEHALERLVARYLDPRAE